MGMDTYVKGMRSEDDEEYKKMKKVLLACNEAGVKLPEETAKYFGNNIPELNLLEEALEIDIQNAEEELVDDGVSTRQGIVVNIDKLPSGVRKLMFINSY